MIDPVERLIWEAVYLQEAMDAAGRPKGAKAVSAIVKWARSMSLIAEQFCPNDRDELVGF